MLIIGFDGDIVRSATRVRGRFRRRTVGAGPRYGPVGLGSRVVGASLGIRWKLVGEPLLRSIPINLAETTLELDPECPFLRPHSAVVSICQRFEVSTNLI
ncbi:hypothetical protein AWN90_07490 [Nocardia terpenica]|uniref:Uncharacterized protein n=1 Tax=Nocardia terpenica TaxID=455432 RepID=A0A164INY5_9NOCA|nr:hypothetical protein AWN90_07490 [Nocardia terpenica]